MRLIQDLKRHEGFRPRPYRCQAGKLTIGYGINLEAGISEREAAALLVMRVNDLEKSLCAYPWFIKLSSQRQAVIVNMAYNLGISGLLTFGRMIAAITAGDFAKAAVEMLDSRWAGQVGLRATELANIMRGDHA